MMEFFVPGLPHGKGRPRVTKRGITYTPKKTQVAEGNIVACFQLSFPDLVPLSGQVRLEVDAFFQIPASAPRARRQAMAEGLVRPTKKPDADNILKAVGDALNGVAWDDDSQIVSVRVDKWYADKPGTKIAFGHLIQGGAQ